MKLNLSGKFPFCSCKCQLYRAVIGCIPGRDFQDEPWRICMRVGAMEFSSFASSVQTCSISIVEEVDIFCIYLHGKIIMKNVKKS